jgi:hypothetical protein
MGIFLLLLGSAAVSAYGQDARLNLGMLDHLGDRASEVVDVTVDGNTLKLAGRFLSDKRVDEAKIKELVTALKGVYVKSFQFDDEGDYSMADVEAVRAQLTGPGWTKLVGVRSRRRDNIEVYLMQDGVNITGVAVIAAERRRLTVVNVVGPIDLEKLRELDGRFGIPELDLDLTRP